MSNWEDDIKLLEDNGWVVECESPFEIRTKDGSFASGEAAQIVLHDLKHERDNAFSEADMKDCFGAGVNRGVSIARSLIEKTELDNEFPAYSEYIKKFKEE